MLFIVYNCNERKIPMSVGHKSSNRKQEVQKRSEKVALQKQSKRIKNRS